MDRGTTQRVALMAIHREYADAIMDGIKRVEFRKRRIAEDIQTVWVYATAPISKVIGRFTVEEVVRASPQEIWDRYGTVGIIEQDAFFAYYGKATSAVAIVVGEAERLTSPIALRELNPPPAVPQSFTYISATSTPQVRRASRPDAPPGGTRSPRASLRSSTSPAIRRMSA